MKSFDLIFIFGLLAFFAGCSEPAGSGAEVSIPRVFVNCLTPNCRNANPAYNPRIIVVFTTSGCVDIDYGGVVTSSTLSMSCNSQNGCYGEITDWVNSSGTSTSTIPTGSYSICARIDYNRDYPETTSGDTNGKIDSADITSGTANEFITLWTDI